MPFKRYLVWQDGDYLVGYRMPRPVVMGAVFIFILGAGAGCIAGLLTGPAELWVNAIYVCGLLVAGLSCRAIYVAVEIRRIAIANAVHRARAAEKHGYLVIGDAGFRDHEDAWVRINTNLDTVRDNQRALIALGAIQEAATLDEFVQTASRLAPSMSKR